MVANSRGAFSPRRGATNGASCIAIYGETCAGKSTVGKYISSSLGCPYISFGDLKRQAISRGTPVGQAIQQLLEVGCPIPATIGYDVIGNAVVKGLNVMSGYPISLDELHVLSLHAMVIGIIVLDVNEQALVSRHANRRVCPECQAPGTIGDTCPIHRVEMVQRGDVSLRELLSRRRLYQSRIEPFLASAPMDALPRLHLDTSNRERHDVSNLAEMWVKHIIRDAGVSQ